MTTVVTTDTSTTLKTGWLGLGAMGWPMAGHLHRSGQLTGVWNRSADKAAAFVAQHADCLQAESPAALAATVDVLLLCLSADQDVMAVAEQLFPVLTPGQVIIDHSTISPASTEWLAQRAATHQVQWLDAPVTGGVEGAIRGQLAIMVGGEWSAYQAALPILNSYARVSHHLGHSGSGQAAKAVNQLIVAGIAEAVCEGLALMDALDLPRDAMLELLSGGAAGSWFLEHRGRSMLEDRFEHGFAPALMLKDLKISQQLCTQAGFTANTIDLAVADFERLVATDTTSRDISALIRLKRR